MDQTPSSHKMKQSSFVRALTLIPISLLPLAFTFTLMKFRFLQRLMVYPLYLGFIALGIAVGRLAYNLFKNNDEDDDWVAVIAACFIGFGVALLFRSLFTHEMARAFAYEMTPREDD